MPSSNGPLNGTRNKLSNDPRDRGTSAPQKRVEQFENGEKVHLKIDPSVNEGRFHPRFNGKTGEIVGTQGRSFKVKITDGSKEKTLLSTAAHLRRQR
ncbi:50S ribosomal protein L21e [Halocatena halophila]|uniref:50S ribosomal protein L21e n=1 Tax=Halocatena halophila TaxID=2814576 RepID=UPI002ED5A266